MTQKKALKEWEEIQLRTLEEKRAFLAGYYRSHQDFARIFDDNHRRLINEAASLLDHENVYGN